VNEGDDERVVPADGSHHVRSFGTDALAEFEDGSELGVVHVTMVRPFRYLDDAGTFENGEFWGLVEFSDLDESARARLAQGDLVRLLSESGSTTRRLPVASLVVEPVRDVRGDRPRWLVCEVRF